MSCRHCRIGNTMNIRAVTTGIATQLSMCCTNELCTKCDEWSIMEPSMVDMDKLVDNKCDPYDLKKTGNKKTREYQLNLDLNLAMQLIGGGGADYALIASMLNLCCTKRQLKDSFTSNEETIGLHIIDMAAKVVETNLSDEKLASELVDDPISVSAHLLADRKRKEKVVVIETPTNLGVGGESDDVITTVPTWYEHAASILGEEIRAQKRNTGLSMDAGWRKRSSGRRYDSQTGQFFAFGILTGKIVFYHQMSMRCRKCEHKIEHDPKLCSHNYTGSAKGMEPHAAVMCINSIFSRGDAFVGTIVTDDDSSMRSRLKQNGREKVEAGVVKFDDLSNTIKIRESNDHGVLDLDVPEPICKADANHRVRAYGNALHKLVAMKKDDSGGVTGVDRDRLKQNFCYARAKNVQEDFAVFKEAFKPSIEHHFNNHTLCGEWCAAKKLTDQGKSAAHLHYRSKVKDEKMYEKIKAVHAVFTSDEKLSEIHHKVNTNLSESANFVVTKFLPKHKHYGTTICDKSRVSLAVCIISNGYVHTMVDLYARMGMKVTVLMLKGWTEIDQDREYNKRYHKLESVKRKRVMRNSIKKRENRKKEEKQKRVGEWYATGMGLNADTTQSALRPVTRGKKRKKELNHLTVRGERKKEECKRCKRKDHFIKCKRCPYHDNYVSPPGGDIDVVKAMKESYPNGMHLNKIVDEHDVTLVDMTVTTDDEEDLTSGK
jgi:hypothetical protein